jgi:hypothetical protein
METTKNTPTLEEWKKLYDLMAQVKNLAPWNWMEESDIFGIQIPETGGLGFVSVMGMLGEHFAVAVYQGSKGLAGFWQMQSQGSKLSPEFVLQVPQLQVSFEDRDLITKEDRAVMKQLGLIYRGANAWPQFRSYRPGCFPWHIETDEAQVLVCALEQLVQVAPRFQEDPDLFTPTKTEHDYLVRVNNNGEWEDRIKHIVFREEKTLDLLMNEEALEHLRTLMPGILVVEIDLYMMDEPVQEKPKERPFFPFLLMLADHESGMILGVDMLTPLPSLEEMWSEVPGIVVEKLANDLAPREIHVKDDMLYILLQPVAQEVGFNLKKQSRLKQIDHAKRQLRNFTNSLGF